MAKSKNTISKKKVPVKKKRVFVKKKEKKRTETFVGDPEDDDNSGIIDAEDIPVGEFASGEAWDEDGQIPVGSFDEPTAEEVAEERLTTNYPSPSSNPVFKAKWKEYLPDVIVRENFKIGHLSQLKILCDLHVEYDKLSNFIDKKGYVYKSYGRNGVQFKQWPQVAQRNRAVSEIRQYAKTLGLLLVKDKDTGNNTAGEKAEWD